MSPYKVSVISPEEAELFLRSIKTPENKRFRRTLTLSEGFELRGEFTVTARDVRSQEVEWRVERIS